jgi:hypothetical protein
MSKMEFNLRYRDLVHAGDVCHCSAYKYVATQYKHNRLNIVILLFGHQTDNYMMRLLKESGSRQVYLMVDRFKTNSALDYIIVSV